MKYLNLSENDSMFVITSGGDNALHYAIAASPKRIHCVDINPCQNHVLELKLAALQSPISHSTFFSLFGLGHHRDFQSLLDDYLAPHLSSSGYAFWRLNAKKYFSINSPFYRHGYTGIAVRLAGLITSLCGLTGAVKEMCNAPTLEEQHKIWKEKLRPVFLNRMIGHLVMNSAFCWNALGVPTNQLRMIREEEGDILDYGTNFVSHVYRILFSCIAFTSCLLHLFRFLLALLII
jgi:betaine lipid synthase